MSVAALVPAKSFGRAKSRLAGVLSSDERARLARACFSRVIGALGRSSRIDRVTVCTDGEEVAALARALGCSVVADPTHATAFSAIVDAGLRAIESTARRALVVMADLPEAVPSSFDPVLDADAEVAIVRDAEGLGTSALALPLPAPFETAFGRRDSASAHHASALAAGLRAAYVDVPSLARDVDGPLDLIGRDELLAR